MVESIYRPQDLKTRRKPLEKIWRMIEIREQTARKGLENFERDKIISNPGANRSNETN